MPPQKRRLTDEEKAKLFEDWQQGDEYRVIGEFNKARMANPLIIGVDNATNDISEDWSEVCKQWFNLVEVLKVPGRKGKRKNFIIQNDDNNLFLCSLRISHDQNNVLEENWR